MDRNFILSILISLILTMGFIISGCGWIGILDTNPYDDGISLEDEKYCKNYISQFRLVLLGLSKKEILSELGQPIRKNTFDNFQMTSKFRENQYIFDGNKKCQMSECGPIFMDESWIYRSKIDIDDDKSVRYEWAIYFKNGIVVSVE